MAGLLYLKHAHDLSGEDTCLRGLENPYGQFFTGEVFFQTHLPCDPSSLTRWRQRLGEAGMEELLAQNCGGAHDAGDHATRSGARDCGYDGAGEGRGLSDRQPLAGSGPQKAGDSGQAPWHRTAAEREDPRLRRRAGGYAHAKQFKRLRRLLRRQRTLLGRVIRDIRRQLETATDTARDVLTVWLERAARLHQQRPRDKHKLCALHAPEAECIGKGKARQSYEFGVKVSLAITARKGLVVGARSFPGTPYHGDTLAEQREQTARTPTPGGDRGSGLPRM